MARATASGAPRPRRRGTLVVAAACLCLLLLARAPGARGQAAAVADETAAVVDEAPAPVDETTAGDVAAPAAGDAVCDDVEDLDATPEGSAEFVAEEDAEEAAAPEASDGEETAEVGTAAAPDAEEGSATPADAAAPATGADGAAPEAEAPEPPAAAAPPLQAGPFVDLLGDQLLSLQMVDETHAQVLQHPTNEALSGKKVVGLYFSADWCGPCKQFTPELVDFYTKMNARRGKKDQFEIVWVSRCRTVDAFGQYFTHMPWLALPPDVATGPRGQALGEKYKVQGIPSLVLLDEIGNVITLDGRGKIPLDRAGIGFPWRSPLSVLVSALVPRSFRLMVKSQVAGVVGLVKKVLLGRK